MHITLLETDSRHNRMDESYKIKTMIEEKYTSRGSTPKNWRSRIGSDANVDSRKPMNVLMSYRTSLDTRSRGKLYSNLRRNYSANESAPKQLSSLRNTCQLPKRQAPDLRLQTNGFMMQPYMYKHSLSFDPGDLTVQSKRKKICIIPESPPTPIYPTKSQEDNIVSYYKTKYERKPGAK